MGFEAPQGLIGQIDETLAITDLSDVSAVTGTGTTVVFSASPTFTGTLNAAGITFTGVMLAPNGTAGAPSYSFSNDSDTGWFGSGSYIAGSVDGTAYFGVFTDGIQVKSTSYIGFASGVVTAGADVSLARDAAAVLALKNGTTAQEFRVYGTTTGSKYLSLKHDGTNGLLTTTAGYLSLASNAGGVVLPGAAITAGSGTGLTVNDTAQISKVTYKVTVDYTALSAAATTADKTIATLPAKTRVISIYADTTTKYIGGAVSACALIVGTTVGGAELIATHDVFTAAITRGLVDADMGTLMTRAAAIQGGTMPSFTATNIVSVRITTTTANTNALTQGSTTYYIETEVLP